MQNFASADDLQIFAEIICSCFLHLFYLSHRSSLTDAFLDRILLTSSASFHQVTLKKHFNMDTSNRKLSYFILLGLFFLFCHVKVASSCSLIRTSVSSVISSADAGEKVIARTMELGSRFLLPLWEFVVMPRQNSEYSNLITSFLLLDNVPSYLTKYDPTTDLNKYGMVVISGPLGKGTATSLSKINIITEGQNEKGLSVSGLVLTTSRYQSLDVNPCVINKDTETCSTSTLLSWLDVVPYLLSRATTAVEAIQ